MHSMQDKGEGGCDITCNNIMIMGNLDMHSVRETDTGTRHEREHTDSTQQGTQAERAQAHTDAMEMRG